MTHGKSMTILTVAMMATLATLAALSSGAARAQVRTQKTFDSPEAAVQALIGATSKNDSAELAAVLPSPARRSARVPSALVRQLSGLYERRAETFPGLDACVRSP